MKMEATSQPSKLAFWKNLVRWASMRTPDFPTKLRWLGAVFHDELKQMSLMELPLIGGGGIRFHIAPGSVIGQDILLHGLYEKALALRFLETIRPGDLVVDVGANLGHYTLLAAHKAGPQGLVIAIEPVPHVARQLAAHVELNNFKNVRIAQVALGREEGDVHMEVIADHNDGMHHVAVAGSANTVCVPLRRLDSVLAELAQGRPVNVMKIDVEGWEEAVLDGAEALFRQDVPPTIFFESINGHAERFGFKAETVRQKMVSNGMKLEGLYEKKWSRAVWRSVDAADGSAINFVAAAPPQRGR